MPNNFRVIALMFLLTAVVATTDAGPNGSEYSNFSSLVVIDESSALLTATVGVEGEILLTRDGGATWTTSYRCKCTIFALRFASEKTGWAIGSVGTILRTEDGGRSWVRMDSPTGEPLYAIDVADNGQVWIVGNGGTILSTRNNGIEWTSHTPPTKIAFTGVGFIDRMNGFAVGYKTVLSTNDGGKSWRETASDEWWHLSSVYIQGDMAWISARTALLPVDKSGLGTGWYTPPGQGTISGVFFANGTLGWMIRTRSRDHLPEKPDGKIASEGTILRTDDGGRSWKVIKVFSSIEDQRYALSSVYFRDEMNGSILTTSGLMITTSDGGKTWKQDNLKKDPVFQATSVERQELGIDGQPKSDRGPAIELCDIQAKPSEFLNKTLEVRADYVAGFEMGWLEDVRGCDAKQTSAIVYLFDEEFAKATGKDQHRRFERKIKIRRGVGLPRSVRGTYRIRVEPYAKRNEMDRRFEYQIRILAAVAVE